MARGDSYQLQGQQGGVVLSVGGAQTTYVGVARWVQCVTDCTFTTLSGNLVNSANLAGKTFLAGSGIGATLTNVVISAGTAIVYDA
jgi:hypothetical protein